VLVFRERLREVLHDLGDQFVGLAHRILRTVHKGGLDFLPLSPELLDLAGGEQRRGLLLGLRAGCGHRLAVRCRHVRRGDVRCDVVGRQVVVGLSGRAHLGVRGDSAVGGELLLRR
jgi:hypothetical protein